MTTAFAVLAVLILVIGLFSIRLKGGMITVPMICVLAGYLLGPHVELLPTELRHQVQNLEFVLELVLIMVLFNDAAKARLKCACWTEFLIPVRMLTVGIVLSIAVGTVAGGLLFPGLGLWSAALMASILTATDAALGKNIMDSPLVPLRFREILNVESGLNDGLVLPLVLLFSAYQSMGIDDNLGYQWLGTIAMQIIGGFGMGLGVGYVGGLILRFGSRAYAINRIFEQLSGFAIALLAYSLADLVGANGFVSVFIAGLVVAKTSKEIPERFLEFTEAQTELLSLIAFTVFGAFMLQPALQAATWETWVYALLMLTVVRMVAVGISLIGVDLKRDEVLLLAWLGPRGIASLLFGLIVMEGMQVGESEQIFSTICITVFISIYLHGLSAVPIAKCFGSKRL